MDKENQEVPGNKKAKIKLFFELLFLIIKLSFISYGGGNAIFPILKTYVIDQKKWFSNEEFDEIVIITNSIPGPSVIESISYICIKKIGKFWGTIVTFVGLLPHLFLALGLLVLGVKFIPQQYLLVINVAVMPAIIALLILFSVKYIKNSQKHLPTVIWVLILLFTIAFTIFVPTPFNIPAIVMIVVIVSIIIKNKIKKNKITKEDKQNLDIEKEEE